MRVAKKNQEAVKREQSVVRRMMAYQKKMEKAVTKTSQNHHTGRKG